MKKVFSVLCALSLVFCLGAVAFASSPTGQAGFVSEVTTALSAETIWGVIIPIVPLIAIITLIALARRVTNKNLNGATKGKSGRV